MVNCASVQYCLHMFNFIKSEKDELIFLLKETEFIIWPNFPRGSHVKRTACDFNLDDPNKTKLLRKKAESILDWDSSVLTDYIWLGCSFTLILVFSFWFDPTLSLSTASPPHQSLIEWKLLCTCLAWLVFRADTAQCVGNITCCSFACW